MVYMRPTLFIYSFETHFKYKGLKKLESPLDCKEIQPVHPKGDQSWVFIGRTDVEAEIPILWPPDGKSWLIWKDTDAGKDRRWEEKGMTEDETVGWHHRLNGHGFGWTGKPGMLRFMGVTKSQTQLSEWTGTGEVRSIKMGTIFHINTEQKKGGEFIFITDKA